MVAFTDPRVEIVKEIRYFVEEWNRASSVKIPPLVHVAVCLQESNLNPALTGDNGQSPGIFQIYQIAHPNTDQLAINPYADYGYYIVRPQWETAWQQLNGDSVWPLIANRAAFLEQFAPLAQGSIAWPPGTGLERYSEAVALWELAG